MTLIILSSLLILTCISSCNNPNKALCQAPETYTNPIIAFDYSDPDAIRVGDDYWMTASSFNAVPGLPILHSKDLVNWELSSYALPELYCPASHGGGVWAPCIRFHDGWFYIYWGDPDYGIYMVKTQDPRGEWESPVLVKAGKGLIDPSPLWDDNGKAYLVHAWANSRCGFNSVLSMFEMSTDGCRAISEEIMVFDGNQGGNTTVEGAKIYKRNGWYYIFAPAGGVAEGWQLVMRSRNIWGPYEEKTVLAQGSSDINGPHQGAWVETQKGEHWFIHFQELQPYGRILHLEPMSWGDNDWCVMGVDPDGDGCGEPVREHKRPNLEWSPKTVGLLERMNDEFNESQMGLQWQWHGNAQDWFSLRSNYGFHRLYSCIEPYNGLWNAQNLLLQKLPAEIDSLCATTKLHFVSKSDGDAAGMVVMGLDYARSAVRRCGEEAVVELVICHNADKGDSEQRYEICRLPMKSDNIGAHPGSHLDIWFRAIDHGRGLFTFQYSPDGLNYYDMRHTKAYFAAREGKWIGAKIGLYCISEQPTSRRAWIDVDWFRVDAN